MFSGPRYLDSRTKFFSGELPSAHARLRHCRAISVFVIAVGVGILESPRDHILGCIEGQSGFSKVHAHECSRRAIAGADSGADLGPSRVDHGHSVALELW